MNICIDPLGDDLPYHRYKEVKEHVVEIRAMQVRELWRSRRVQDRKDARDLEAEQLAQAQPDWAAPTQPAGSNDGYGPLDHEVTVADALVSQRPPAELMVASSDDFLHDVCRKYATDALYAEIQQHPEDYP
ncbi:hypothetical protein C0992_005100 [Termitomyces sp. T32_za158]|nr:hypothetical protein C0992_005100 [Termitomyces sp. T32_za158]